MISNIPKRLREPGLLAWDHTAIKDRAERTPVIRLKPISSSSDPPSKTQFPHLLGRFDNIRGLRYLSPWAPLAWLERTVRLTRSSTNRLCS